MRGTSWNQRSTHLPLTTAESKLETCGTVLGLGNAVLFGFGFGPKARVVRGLHRVKRSAARRYFWTPLPWVIKYVVSFVPVWAKPQLVLSSEY